MELHLFHLLFVCQAEVQIGEQTHGAALGFRGALAVVTPWILLQVEVVASRTCGVLWLW